MRRKTLLEVVDSGAKNMEVVVLKIAEDGIAAAAARRRPAPDEIEELWRTPRRALRRGRGPVRAHRARARGGRRSSARTPRRAQGRGGMREGQDRRRVARARRSAPVARGRVASRALADAACALFIGGRDSDVTVLKGRRREVVGGDRPCRRRPRTRHGGVVVGAHAADARRRPGPSRGARSRDFLISLQPVAGVPERGTGWTIRLGILTEQGGGSSKGA